MKLIDTNLNVNEIAELMDIARTAGRICGRREHREGVVFMLTSPAEQIINTTGPNGPMDTIEGADEIKRTFSYKQECRWATPIASTRFSRSQGKIVYTVNDLVTDMEIRETIRDAMKAGYEIGVGEYEDAVAFNELFESLKDRILIDAGSAHGRSAYFASAVDGDAFCKAKAGPINANWSVVFVAREEDDMVNEVCERVEQETGEALKGLFRAWVSLTPAEDAA